MAADLKRMTEAVRIANDAVADLEEPLKTEGFKILLNKLLSSSPGGEVAAQSEPGRQQGGKVAGKAKRAVGRKESRASRPATSLQLGVAELKSLKAYCERFELQGSEQIAFVLANYAREHTDLEVVTAADIEYLYRQLVSQRVKVSPVNDLSDWSRALNWLAAPSRRKEWLVKHKDGHMVSNSGLLRFHEMEEQLSGESTKA
jgi:hypothetical protein